MTADIIYDQLYHHGDGDRGVYRAGQPSDFPDRYAVSGYNPQTNQVSDFTVLYPRAFQSDHELALTLAHEAYGHQALNNPYDETMAEMNALPCGTEN